MSRSDRPYALDLDAYLARIGWSGELRVDAATLRSVHRAHILGIPFENLAPLLGDVPSLALPDLERKLLHSRRGGYCYEHNTLLSAGLRALGFTVTPLAARVRVGATGIRPRTHMALLVDVPGEPVPYLADAGFGNISLLEAVPLVADVEFDRGAWRMRLVHEPHHGPLDLWVLQLAEQDGWSDLYAFTLEPYEPADFEVANWHMATNPRSPFRQNLSVQRAGIDVHLALWNLKSTVSRGDGSRTERELSGEAELREVLEADFGILLPEGIRLPF